MLPTAFRTWRFYRPLAIMFLLITFVLVALVFSFLCSIAEAVILSVTPAYIAVPTRIDIGSLKRNAVFCE